MTMSPVVRLLSTLCVAVLLLFARAASAADVHVMISAAYFQVYAELGPAFEKAERPSSGHDTRAVDRRFCPRRSRTGFRAARPPTW